MPPSLLLWAHSILQALYDLINFSALVFHDDMCALQLAFHSAL